MVHQATHNNDSLSSDEATCGVESANAKHSMNISGNPGVDPGTGARQIGHAEPCYCKGLPRVQQMLLKASQFLFEALTAAIAPLFTERSQLKQRPNIARILIIENVERLLHLTDGKPLLTSKSVQNGLRLLKINRPVPDLHDIGQQLGANGLGLPTARLRSGIYFDLSFVKASLEERAAGHARLKDMNSSVRRSLVGVIGVNVKGGRTRNGAAAE